MEDKQIWPGYLATTGESPLWDAATRTLLWVDIRGHAVLESDWSTKTTRQIPAPTWPAFVAPMRSGALLVGARDGLWQLDRSTGASKPLPPPADFSSDVRFNDGAVDPLGRLVIGTTARDREQNPVEGALYALDASQRWHVLLDGLGIVNGVAFSPDGRTMFVSDSHPDRRRVCRYEYDSEGVRLGAGRTIAAFDERGWAGVPDGAACDAEGGYWIAALGGGALLRLTPDGELDRRIDLPFTKVSKPAFVGPDLNRIAVTSFAEPASGGHPDAGRLLTFDAGVRGAPLPALAI